MSVEELAPSGAGGSGTEPVRLDAGEISALEDAARDGAVEDVVVERDLLRVRVVPCGRSALVCVAGELDLSTAPLLEAALTPLLRTRRTPRLSRLVIDLADVPFADVNGLNPVLLARGVLLPRGGALELRGAEPAMLTVLDVLGLSAHARTPPSSCVGPEAPVLPQQAPAPAD